MSTKKERKRQINDDHPGTQQTFMTTHCMSGPKLSAGNTLVSKINAVPALIELMLYRESIMGVQRRSKYPSCCLA